MARIRTQHFKSENLNFKYDVNVDKEGTFSTTIPQVVVAEMVKVGIKLGMNRLNNEGYFTARSLDELKREVETVAKQFSEKELVEEKIVVKYAIDTFCHYCKGKKGLYPNGGLQQDVEGYDSGYNWLDGTKKHDGGPYGFEFAFLIWKVKIWKFPNGEIKREYDRLEEPEAKKDETLWWLHSVVRMGFDFQSSTQEIDYTPEIGLFFKNLVLHIWNINENICEFFGEKVDLSKIELSKLKLLGFTDTKEGE